MRVKLSPVRWKCSILPSWWQPDWSNNMQPTNYLPPVEEIILDYRLAFRRRQVSYIGRREVLSGKAKFGIFGDGKELPQLAMAHVFKNGDFRSGYYRDQTITFATGVATIQQFFAQLYANLDVELDPSG